MLKKLFIATAVTATLSVPLAAFASADPSDENPGVPGTIGSTPGSLVKDYNQAGQPIGAPGHLLGPGKGFSSVGQQQGK